MHSQFVARVSFIATGQLMNTLITIKSILIEYDSNSPLNDSRELQTPIVLFTKRMDSQRIQDSGIEQEMNKAPVLDRNTGIEPIQITESENSEIPIVRTNDVLLDVQPASILLPVEIESSIPADKLNVSNDQVEIPTLKMELGLEPEFQTNANVKELKDEHLESNQQSDSVIDDNFVVEQYLPEDEKPSIEEEVQVDGLIQSKQDPLDQSQESMVSSTNPGSIKSMLFAALSTDLPLFSTPALSPKIIKKKVTQRLDIDSDSDDSFIQDTEFGISEAQIEIKHTIIQDIKKEKINYGGWVDKRTSIRYMNAVAQTTTAHEIYRKVLIINILSDTKRAPVMFHRDCQTIVEFENTAQVPRNHATQMVNTRELN